MVDVSPKPITVRTAIAGGRITMQPATNQMIRQGQAAKGDVLGVARIAAINAVKMTPALIPLCHGIPVEAVAVQFAYIDDVAVECMVEVRSTGRTGVEMEALAGVMTACLTIYDMCKSVDRGMQIENVRLLRKTGGQSGTFTGV